MVEGLSFEKYWRFVSQFNVETRNRFLKIDFAEDSEGIWVSQMIERFDAKEINQTFEQFPSILLDFCSQLGFMVMDGVKFNLSLKIAKSINISKIFCDQIEKIRIKAFRDETTRLYLALVGLTKIESVKLDESIRILKKLSMNLSNDEKYLKEIMTFELLCLYTFMKYHDLISYNNTVEELIDRLDHIESHSENTKLKTKYSKLNLKPKNSSDLSASKAKIMNTYNDEPDDFYE